MPCAAGRGKGLGASRRELNERGAKEIDKVALGLVVFWNPRTFKLYYDGKSYWFWVNIPRSRESKSFVSPFSNETISAELILYTHSRHRRTDIFSCQKLCRSQSILFVKHGPINNIYIGNNIILYDQFICIYIIFFVHVSFFWLQPTKKI